VPASDGDSPFIGKSENDPEDGLLDRSHAFILQNDVQILLGIKVAPQMTLAITDPEPADFERGVCKHFEFRHQESHTFFRAAPYRRERLDTRSLDRCIRKSLFHIIQIALHNYIWSIATSDHPAVQVDRAVAERFYPPQIMGDKEDRDTALKHGMDSIDALFLKRRVTHRQGFINDIDIRFQARKERKGQADVHPG
jgi:hypothetical protein